MELYTLPVGQLLTNCYLLASQAKRVAIIDPGDDAADIVAELEKRGLTPALILLTHGHFDHVGAVLELREAYGVPVCGDPTDGELFEDLKRRRGAFLRGGLERYRVEPDRPVGDGDVLELDELWFRVIATPGHTRGGVCYQCDDLLFTGDTLFAGSVGRCDLFGGDLAVLTSSLQKLKMLAADYTVLPGHGPATTLAQEKAENPYLR